MSEEIIQIDTSKRFIRWLLVLGLILPLASSFFVVRWYVGNTIAEYLVTDESSLDSARLAVKLAPNDPLAHWRLAEVSQRRLPADQTSQAIAEYERSVSLAPNDYRFWMSLGVALEQTGDTDRAEKALRRSIELAPSYAFPAWYHGNLLLRLGRYDEAFTELRRASEADPELRPQLFNLAWEVYSGKIDWLRSAIGTTAEARAEFSKYLFARQRFEDGLHLWDTLDENEKRTNRETGDAIVAGLLGNRRFHDAVKIWNDLAPSAAVRATIGQVVDGGFEAMTAHGPDAVFGWQVKTNSQLQTGIDPAVGHSGSRSLRIIFQVRSQLDPMNISQLVAVDPAAEYDFECYVKTNNLQSAGTPVVAITEAYGPVLASSAPVAVGTNDWQRVALSFKTNPQVQAVVISISRASCGENSVCPIFGTVWYDDFNLKRRN